MMDKNITTETITNLTKGIVLEDDRIQSLYEKIRIMRAVFQAVHYAAVEGGIAVAEADEALTGIGMMLDSLIDNAEEAMEFSNAIVKEVI